MAKYLVSFELEGEMESGDVKNVINQLLLRLPITISVSPVDVIESSDNDDEVALAGPQGNGATFGIIKGVDNGPLIETNIVIPVTPRQHGIMEGGAK